MKPGIAERTMAFFKSLADKRQVIIVRNGHDAKRVAQALITRGMWFDFSYKAPNKYNFIISHAVDFKFDILRSLTTPLIFERMDL